MRKILVLFVVLVNILGFQMIVNIYQEQDVSDAYHLYGYKDGKYVYHAEMKYDVDQAKLLACLHHLSQKYDCMIYQEEANDEEKRIRYDILYAHSLKSLQLITNHHQVLSGDHYYSNQKGKGYYFYTLNKEYQVSLHHLTKLKGTQFTVVTQDFEVLKQIEETLSKRFPKQFLSFEKVTQEKYHGDLELRRNLKQMLILMSVCTLLILMIDVFKRSRTFGIMKSVGLSINTVLVKVFSFELSVCIIVPVLTLVILFILFIHVLNQATFSLLRSLAVFGTGEIICTIILIMIANGVMYHMNTLNQLKGRETHKGLLAVNYILKGLCLFLFAGVIVNSIGEIKQDGRFLLGSYDQVEGYYMINGLKRSYVNDGYNIEKYNEGKFDDMYDMYQRNYDYANQNGALYFEVSSMMINDHPHDVLLVNQNYMKLILPKVHFDQQAITYVVPPDISEQTILENINDTKATIKVMHHQIDQYPNFAAVQGQTIKHPYFAVYGDQAERINKSLFVNVYYRQKALQKVLHYAHYENKVEITKTKDMLESYKASIKNDLYGQVEKIALPLAVLVLISVEYMYMYSKVYRLKRAVKYLLGQGMIGQYGDLFVELLLADLFLIVKDHSFNAYLFYTLTICVDLIIFIIMFIKLQQKNVTLILKGED